ncbi:MAG: hypothetical protein ACRENS_01415 [Candidatus Eiseniibacteriota bacterium]
MNVRPRPIAAIALVGAICALLVSGCTVLGFGTGAIVDQIQTTRYDPRPPELVRGTSLKTPVVLVMRDSTEIAGRYMGVEPDETVDIAAPPGSGTDAGTRMVAILESDGTVVRVAVDSIAALAVAAPKHGKLVGTVIGLGIDIVYAVYLAYFATWD